MLKKSLRTNYQRKLARPLTLADGTKLFTLHDAANVLLDVFTSVNAPSGVLGHAIGSLLTETGERADLVEATEAIERVLRAAPALNRSTRRSM